MRVYGIGAKQIGIQACPQIPRWAIAPAKHAAIETGPAEKHAATARHVPLVRKPRPKQGATHAKHDAGPPATFGIEMDNNNINNKKWQGFIFLKFNNLKVEQKIMRRLEFLE
jgi:hypothetical protein